jgi:hypothetical protein
VQSEAIQLQQKLEGPMHYPARHALQARLSVLQTSRRQNGDDQKGE